MATQEVDPKMFLVRAASHALEGVELMHALDEQHVGVKQIERIQKKLSEAASEVTKLKTWMVENLPPVKDNDH